MVDARWTDVEAELQGSIEHFRKAIQLFDQNQFDEPDLEGYKARMAFMHAMQSGYTSFESGLLKVLSILDEAHPSRNETWHADLINRVAREITGNRPAILSPDTAKLADELMRFRHVAVRSYNNFRPDQARNAVAAVRKLVDRILPEIVTFRTVIDPEEDDGGGDGAGGGAAGGPPPRNRGMGGPK